MSIKDFQAFISTDSQLQNSPYGPCVRTVNLLHLHDSSSPYGFGPMQAAAYAAAAQRTQTPMARHNLAQMQRMGMIQRGPMPIQPIMVQNRVALVLDAESCLDRLYGGYFPGMADLDMAFASLLLAETNRFSPLTKVKCFLFSQIGVVAVNGDTCIAS